MSLVGCNVEVCPRCLHHVCQGEYVTLNYIDFDGREKNICYVCVNGTGWGGGLGGWGIQ